MKKLALLFLPVVLLWSSCSKDNTPAPPIDESEWLNQDRGVVVASSFQCDFYVVETRYGYAVMRNWGGFAPIRGAVLYGRFNGFGVHTFYNRSEGYLMTADIRDLTPSYFLAIDQMNWNCSQLNGNWKTVPADSTQQN